MTNKFTINWQIITLLHFAVYFLLGNSPSSEFYMSTFRNVGI